MNQTTTFSPHLVCKLLDGRTVRFARSKLRSHWGPICEEIAASQREAALAEIDASDMPERDKVAERARARTLLVPVQTAIHWCLHFDRWIERHLTLAYVEAGGREEEAADVLDLIPPLQQTSIAEEIAMLPVVKNNPLGTEANPLVPGVEFRAASTGGEPSPSSGDATPASTPAN